MVLPMAIHTKPFGLLLLGRLYHPRRPLLARRPCREPVGMMHYKTRTRSATVLTLIAILCPQVESLLIAMSPGP